MKPEDKTLLKGIFIRKPKDFLEDLLSPEKIPFSQKSHSMEFNNNSSMNLTGLGMINSNRGMLPPITTKS